jgi:hypothetical protein
MSILRITFCRVPRQSRRVGPFYPDGAKGLVDAAFSKFKKVEATKKLLGE